MTNTPILDEDQQAVFETLKRFATNPSMGKSRAVELAAMYGDPAVHAAIVAWNPPEFPLTGADLLEYGYREGVEVGKTLRYLRNRWIESNYTADKAALLALLPSETRAQTGFARVSTNLGKF